MSFVSAIIIPELEKQLVAHIPIIVEALIKIGANVGQEIVAYIENKNSASSAQNITQNGANCS